MKSVQVMLLKTLIATSVLVALTAAAFGDTKPAPSSPASPPPAKAAKAKPALPDVTLPYTFECPHCGMKIVIKTVDDWNKGCYACACGETNLGCYNDSHKKPAH
jgi:hypothetical protein